MEVDHVNGDGLDNRRSNLRVCTHAENARNQSSRTRMSTSRFRGVVWAKDRRKWRAMIGDNGRTVHLGNFTDEIEAAQAYDRAAREMYGAFARLNFPETEG
jgi:hypothetical protein